MDFCRYGVREYYFHTLLSPIKVQAGFGYLVEIKGSCDRIVELLRTNSSETTFHLRGKQSLHPLRSEHQHENRVKSRDVSLIQPLRS
jgi:hypothetical protein